MKQAILITAYKDFDQLCLLVDFFDQDFNIYIHVDKKSTIPEDLKSELTGKKNVKYLRQDYKVNWGGVNHLKSYLKLAEISLHDVDNAFFHLISGQDYPIKNLKYFKRLAGENKDNIKDYLAFRKMPKPDWHQGGMDRLEYYNLYDFFDARKKWRKKIIQFLVDLQKKTGFKRPINRFPGQLYGGSTYWSLSRATLQYVIDYTRNNKHFSDGFKYTFCAEEIYFQTVILNSVRSGNVVNNNQRYVDWKTQRGGNPAFLDEGDFEMLMESNKIFARKIDGKRNGLLFMLRNYLIQ